jgi:hypothetical protein
LLAEQRLASPCIDDISHAAALILKRIYQHHPAFEAFLSACGRVSGHWSQLKRESTQFVPSGGARGGACASA